MSAQKQQQTALAASLSWEIDEFLAGKSIWSARLSDGTTVYGDDDRPGREPANSWLRLRSYIEGTGLKIDQLYFHSGAYVVELPKSDYGYAVVRGFAALDIYLDSPSKSFATLTFCALRKGGGWDRIKFKANGLVVIQEDYVAYEKYENAAIKYG